MPTNQNVYNSRVTDEALEKRFRDTFTSQGGSELVSDLYAQGVIVPIVDFTAAATGDVLQQNLQTAWDFSTGHAQVENTSSTIINTPGFWQIGIVANMLGNDDADFAKVSLSDGLTSKIIWQLGASSSVNSYSVAQESAFVVFVRSGDSVSIQTGTVSTTLDAWYRQIADVSGNLTNPLGFTSS